MWKHAIPSFLGLPQALVAQYGTLLYEYHDFVASQHPSALPALWQIASKYLIPSRMGKY
jgi:hypothetical protein